MAAQALRRNAMHLLSTRDRQWMLRCAATLLSEGVDARWWPLTDPAYSTLGVVALDVPTSEAERVAQILSEQLGEELAVRSEKEALAQAASVQASTPLLDPGIALGICLAVLCLAFYGITGGSKTDSAWFRAGALVYVDVRHGEYWRLITAATLHADTGHALSNASFFLVLAWAAADTLGVGIALGVWLATALAGFGASLVFSHAYLTVGASGGLFGLLGAAAGAALRRDARPHDPFRRRIRIVGGAVLLVAYTAFSPTSNIPAHLGGFVAGVLLGLSAGHKPPTWVWQVLSALTTAVVIWGAWAWARMAVGAP